MLAHVPPPPSNLSRLYACVILLEKRNFIKLREKPNCLKIGSGRAPAPRSVGEAFRGFRQLRVFPQAIPNQYFPLLPSENHTNICSNCKGSYCSTWSPCLTVRLLGVSKIQRNKNKKLFDIRTLTTPFCNSPSVLYSHLFQSFLGSGPFLVCVSFPPPYQLAEGLPCTLTCRALL